MERFYEHFNSLVTEIFSKAPAIAAKTEEEAMYKGLLNLFFIKSWKTFQGIHILCQHKLAEDAAILARSLFELTVNLFYISADPLPRARLFWEYDHVQRKALLDKLSKVPDDPWTKGILEKGNSEALRDLRMEYARVEKNYPDKYHWSGKKLRGMAKEVNLELLYNYPYSIFSNFVHSSPQALRKFIRSTGAELEVTLHSSAEDEDIEMVWGFSCVCFLLVLDKFLILGLVPKLLNYMIRFRRWFTLSRRSEELCSKHRKQLFLTPSPRGE